MQVNTRDCGIGQHSMSSVLKRVMLSVCCSWERPVQGWVLEKEIRKYDLHSLLIGGRNWKITWTKLWRYCGLRVLVGNRWPGQSKLRGQDRDLLLQCPPKESGSWGRGTQPLPHTRPCLLSASWDNQPGLRQDQNWLGGKGQELEKQERVGYGEIGSSDSDILTYITW